MIIDTEYCGYKNTAVTFFVCRIISRTLCASLFSIAVVPPFTSPHPLSLLIFPKCSVTFHGAKITTDTRLLGVKLFKNIFSSFSNLFDSSSVQADNPVCKTPLCHATLEDPLHVHPNHHVYLLLGTIFKSLS